LVVSAAGVIGGVLELQYSGYWSENGSLDFGVGVLLEQLGVYWSGTGWATVAIGVKTVHWIGVEVLLEL
jgi:hypothetical protein